jgi:hypothetical protein
VPDDQNRKVFFISPIGEVETETRQKADQTLRHLVKKALEPEPLNCEVERADEDTDPGSITPRMLNSIMTADLLVIDLTDQNPNVFYEMAIAHGYRKPCVHIITEGQRVLSDPDKLEAAVTKLRSYAKTALQNGTTTTPLSAAERFRVVQSSTDPTVEALAEIATRLARMENTSRESLRELIIEFWLSRGQDITQRGDIIQRESNPPFQGRIVTGGPNPTIQARTVVSGTAAPWIADQEARQREVPPAD